jgi:Leucine-rich repeat (LRR) protein
VRGTPFSSWEIPSSISSAKSLTELSLNDCGLIGPIPREVTTHQSLLKLDVANNHIDGTLPSFANSQIEMLRFENTQLSGSIPLLPDSLLQQLILRENDLSGGLSRVSTLTRLMILDLANNNLRGDLELSDEALDMLTLFDVSNNYLVSVPAKLSSVDNYLSCNISGNELHCPIDQWLVTHCYGTCK